MMQASELRTFQGAIQAGARALRQESVWLFQRAAIKPFRTDDYRYIIPTVLSRKLIKISGDHKALFKKKSVP